jgi:peptidoglycan/LPS O-acetylase OafA/YrhL
MRIAALDLLRGLAALSVAGAHFFLYAGIAPATSDVVSIMAVEVFFALSGFVLAPQIIRITTNRRVRDLAIFLARRWMRTIPAYLLALICTWLILGSSELSDLGRYAFYLQNLTSQQNTLDYFTVAWSLSVEEWFYLVVPALMLLSTIWTRPWQSALAFVIIIGVLRLWLAPTAHWDDAVRRVTLFRIDAIAYGFLFFVISRRLELERKPIAAILSASVTALALALATTAIVTGRAAAAIEQFFPFVAAAFGISTVWLATTWRRLPSAMIPLSDWAGRLSYSVYLFHSIILTLVFAMTDNDVALRGAIYLGTTLAVAALVYRFIEEPVLDARPRYSEGQTLHAQGKILANAGGDRFHYRSHDGAGDALHNLAAVLLPKMKRFAAHAGVILLSTVIALLCSELALAALWPRSLGMQERMTSSYGDYYLNSPNTETHQTLGGSEATYKINAMGLRGPPFDPAVPSVLVLGDSFTFGYHLNQADTLTAKLQELADRDLGAGKLQILNGAVPAWGLTDQVAFLQDYAWRFKPTVVLSMINYTSISVAYQSPVFSFDGKTLTRTRPLPAANMPYPTPDVFGHPNDSAVDRWLFAHSEIAVLAKQLDDQIAARNYTLGRPQDPQASAAPSIFTSESLDRPRIQAFTRAAIRLLKSQSDALGATLIIADDGFRWQMKPETGAKSIDLVGLEIAPDVVSEIDAPFVDATPAMIQAKQSGRTIELSDGHPTGLANQILAATIWGLLRQRLATLSPRI